MNEIFQKNFTNEINLEKYSNSRKFKKKITKLKKKMQKI